MRGKEDIKDVITKDVNYPTVLGFPTFYIAVLYAILTRWRNLPLLTTI